MRALLISLGLAVAAPLAASGQALAQNEQAGVPLAPSEAAGAWTLATGGQVVCTLSLGRTRTAHGYAVRVPADCGGALPEGVVAWAPTSQGMSLIGAGGQAIDFDRWSNSLLVSKHDSGVDIALSRPGPEG